MPAAQQKVMRHGPGATFRDASCDFSDPVQNSTVLRCQRDGRTAMHVCNDEQLDSYWFRFGSSWHCVQDRPETAPYSCSFDASEAHPWCNEHRGTGYRKQPACCRRRVAMNDTAACSSLCRTPTNADLCADGDTMAFTGHSRIEADHQVVTCTRDQALACRGPTVEVDGCETETK